jgi:Arc/MetJ-type ribon-helix-helix transcriptional regulator
MVWHTVLSTKERTVVPTKVNIVLDDDVKADLDRLVESGRRSRVVNDALRREIQLMRRRAAAARLDDLRRATRRVATTDLVKLVRQDRNR